MSYSELEAGTRAARQHPEQTREPLAAYSYAANSYRNQTAIGAGTDAAHGPREEPKLVAQIAELRTILEELRGTLLTARDVFSGPVPSTANEPTSDGCLDVMLDGVTALARTDLTLARELARRIF